LSWEFSFLRQFLGLCRLRRISFEMPCKAQGCGHLWVLVEVSRFPNFSKRAAVVSS
jgi:hypothetical protein